MNKPILQRIAMGFSFLIAAALFLLDVTEVFSKAFETVTLSRALVASFLICFLFLALYIYKNKKIGWHNAGVKEISVAEIKNVLTWPLVILASSLWLIIIIKYLFGISPDRESRPVFSASDKRFKVLVLPFMQECVYEGKLYNIGEAIKRRLDALNEKDTLNLVAEYLKDSIDYTNYSASEFEALMDYHRADQIVYGAYTLKQCEDNISDKICINYRSNIGKWGFIDNYSKTDYQMLNLIGGMDAIRSGAVQEEVEEVIYIIAGHSSMSMGKFDRALRQFKRIRGYEVHDKVSVSMSICYYQLHTKDSAKSLLESLLAKNSKNSMAWNNLGVLNNELRDIPRAIECYKNAIAVDESNVLALFNLADNYYHIRNFAPAREHLEKATKLDSENYRIWSLLGRICIALKDFVNAKSCLEEALKLNPSDAKTWESMYDLMLHQSRITEAKSYAAKVKSAFEQEIKQNPHKDDPLIHYGVFLMKMGEIDMGVDYLEKALKVNQKNDWVWATLSNYYMNEYEVSKARRCAEEALKLNPKNATALLSMGGVYFEEHNYHKAKECYEESIRNDSTSAFGWINLGNVSFHIDGMNKAKYYYQKAVNINPNYKTIMMEMVLE